MSEMKNLRGAVGLLVALALFGCGSATPEANTPSAEASATAAPLPAASASAAAADPAPSGYVPNTTGAVVDCFCAAWNQPQNRGEVCSELAQKCMHRRRLVDEKLSPGECLPQKREACAGFGCEGEKCYRLR